MQVDGKTPLWPAARSLLSQRVEIFFQQTGLVLKTYDPEDIHDLRVSSRRLRECLAMFSPCYPAEGIDRLSRKVKRATRLLGSIRNTDEATLFFNVLSEEIGPDFKKDIEQILPVFHGARQRELKRLKAGLKYLSAKTTHDLFRRIINAPSLFSPGNNETDLFVPLEQFAGKMLLQRLDTVLVILPEATVAANMESQHLLRIAIKHFRYRMEILHFLFGSQYDEMHGVLKSYQDLLGKMHDLDVFSGMVTDFSFPLKDRNRFLEVFSEKRDRLFKDFSELLENMPFELIGERMRRLL